MLTVDNVAMLIQNRDVQFFRMGPGPLRYDCRCLPCVCKGKAQHFGSLKRFSQNLIEKRASW